MDEETSADIAAKAPSELRRKEALEFLAKNAYADPQRYGFRDQDEVGEGFSQYWERINSLVDRYEERGLTFAAYASVTLRYIARSVRRRRARNYYKERAAVLDQADGQNAEWVAELPFSCLGIDDPPTARARLEINPALRERIAYLCIKCAYALEKPTLKAMASRLDYRQSTFLRARALEAEIGRGRLRLREERRRRRNEAWVRMGANSLRLAQEYDPDRRAQLQRRIDRDRLAYERAVRALAAERPLATNTLVAGLLGVPKGTIDSGLARLKSGLTRARGGYLETGLAGYNHCRRLHDHRPCEQQRP